MKKLFLVAVLAVMLALPVAAFAFDHTHKAFDNTAKRYAFPDGVKYADLKASPQDLDAYLKQIADVKAEELAAFTAEEKLAFWLNAYNAIVLKTVIEKYPVASIKDIEGALDARKWPVAGGQFTLAEIENNILRPMGDPRVLVGISRAAISAPRMPSFAFTPDKVNWELKQLSQYFAREGGLNVYDVPKKTARLSSVFSWNGQDYVTKYYKEGQFPGLAEIEAASLSYLFEFSSDVEKKAMNAGIHSVEYQDFNWALNEKK